MPLQSHNRKIILASSSPYRKSLLEQLGFSFQTCAPDLDESAQPGELLADLVTRLARDKARAVAAAATSALVIGSDQLAECNGEIAGKPGSVDRAVAQLRAFSGQMVTFRTAVAIVCDASDFLFEAMVNTEVVFRTLDDEEIRRYVAADRPLDCAGSFKSEALGISLLERMRSDDPTAIIGLPLIAVTRGLRAAGVDLP